MYDLASLLKNPDQALLNANILLSSKTGVVGVVAVGERKIVIKEHKVLSFFKAIKYLILPSKAYKSWKNAQLLTSCGIFTPKPIGYVEKWPTYRKRHSYYLYEYVEGVDLYSLIKKNGGVEESVIDSIVELIRKLKNGKIAYRDMKASNFVISNDGACLIDIHPIKQSRFRYAASHRHNVARFLFSLRKYPILKERFILCFQRHGIQIDQGMLEMLFPEE